MDYTTSGWEIFSQQAYVQMNQRKPPFDNVKVRQAVMHALNRKFIVDNIFFGLGKVATGPISSSTPFYSADVPKYDYDLKKARALIKESGVDLSKTPVKILAYPYGATWDRLGEYTKQALAADRLQRRDGRRRRRHLVQRVSDAEFDLTFSFTSQYGDPALGVSRLYVTRNIVKGSAFVNNQGLQERRSRRAVGRGGHRHVRRAERRGLRQAAEDPGRRGGQRLPVRDREPTLSRSNVHNLVTTAIGLNDTFANVYIDK